MGATYRRHGLVIGLTLLSGILCVLAPEPLRTPVVPSITHLTVGTPWHVSATLPGGGSAGWTYRQWLLHSTQGDDVILYLAATASPKMWAWDGTLAYQGAGYQVGRVRQEQVRLRDGTLARIAVVSVQRLSDVRALAYTVVTPDDITTSARDHLVRVAWDVLRGGGGPYYLVRASASSSPPGDPAGRAAVTDLLVTILPVLRAEARL